MQFSYLPEGSASPLWPDIAQLLRPAADFGQVEVWETGDLLWVAHEGPVVFAAIVTRLGAEGADIKLASGSRLSEWIGELDAKVTAWARACGAPVLAIRGRKGWGRFARSYGWICLGLDEQGFWNFEKDLTDGQ